MTGPPRPSAQFQFQVPPPPRLSEPPPAGAGPPPPAMRASPEKLIALLVTIANRLERLEGITERMDERVDNLERRFSGSETRWVALNDHVCLTNLLISNLPPLRQIVLAMLAVVAAAILMLALGITLAMEWPRLLQMML